MRPQDTDFYKKIDQIFNPKAEPMVMGILNITPDSFYDGGNYLLEKDWLQHTKQMVGEGADIVDIGAFSTRPGFETISLEEEEKRLLPVVISVRKHFANVLISVDTFRATIAEKAVDAGANIINDISGGTFDDAMFANVARLNVPYILMHINGDLKTMHEKIITDDIAETINEFFAKQINKLRDKGFNKIIIDPGIGFGKTIEQNYEIINNIFQIDFWDLPILIGISRKSFITKSLNIKTEDALQATSALHNICIDNGAKILRVHDVKEAKQLIELKRKFKEFGIHY